MARIILEAEQYRLGKKIYGVCYCALATDPGKPHVHAPFHWVRDWIITGKQGERYVLPDSAVQEI